MAFNRRAFDAKHIPGSLHFDTPDELYAALGKDDEIVVYCSSVDCRSSVALYRALVERGYRNVRRYAGGLIYWEDAGLPLEGSLLGESRKTKRSQGDEGLRAGIQVRADRGWEAAASTIGDRSGVSRRVPGRR
jgi:rhodanese-related sulfurtransferase